MPPRRTISTLFPYTTLFRSTRCGIDDARGRRRAQHNLHIRRMTRDPGTRNGDGFHAIFLSETLNLIIEFRIVWRAQEDSRLTPFCKGDQACSVMSLIRA